MNAAEPPVAHAEDNVTRTSSIHDLRHQSIKVVRCPSVTAQSLQSLFGRPGNTRAGITKAPHRHQPVRRPADPSSCRASSYCCAVQAPLSSRRPAPAAAHAVDRFMNGRGVMRKIINDEAPVGFAFHLHACDMNAGETFERLERPGKDARRTRSGNRCQSIELVVASRHAESLPHRSTCCAERMPNRLRQASIRPACQRACQIAQALTNSRVPTHGPAPALWHWR